LSNGFRRSPYAASTCHNARKWLARSPKAGGGIAELLAANFYVIVPRNALKLLGGDGIHRHETSGLEKIASRREADK